MPYKWHARALLVWWGLAYAGAVMLGPWARATVRLGVGLLLVAAALAAWEWLARQAPGSPLYLGVLPGPVSAARESATVVGLVVLAAGWLMPWAAGGRKEPGWLVVLAYVGAVLVVGSATYAAARGMHGIQLVDPIPGTRPVVVARLVGQVLLGLCLFEFARRILFRKGPS